MEIVVDQMIRKFRKEKGMTVRQLGAEIGVSDSLISLYEAGKRNPPIDACVKLANLFDVSLEVLIRGKEKDRPEERSFESVSNMITRKVKKKAISAFRVWGNINTLTK